RGGGQVVTPEHDRLRRGIERVKEQLAGASVVLVRNEGSATARAEAQDFLATFPTMGVSAIEISFRDVLELLTHDVLDYLTKASFVVKVVHGPQNRSGMLQAILATLRIPVTGHPTGVDVLSQRKSVVKELMSRLGVPTAPYVLAREGQGVPSVAGIAEYDSTRMFVVKPDDGNASEGLFVAAGVDELRRALRVARGTVIAEPYLEGRVFTVGVITIDRLPIPLHPIEYVLSAGQLVMDVTWKRAPRRRFAGDLDRATLDEMTELAVRLHVAIGATALSRSDFIVTRRGIIALEINTNIGLSSHHDIAAAFKENGLSYQDLVAAVCDSAFNGSVVPRPA
ncbi:MAG: hypothetical protein ACRDK3_12360, partial [Actinomycetota bacterium]